MTAKNATRRNARSRRAMANQLRREQAARERRRRRLVLGAWIAGLAVLASVVAALMLSSRAESSATARQAPDFTVTDTTGRTVSLSDYRGQNVLLYFNEGAGCQSCLVQMAEIEKQGGALADLDVTVLPVVMNTRTQITADMAANGVNTPFLLDDGNVSQAYRTLGKGMHAGLPGHSFVLIDAGGIQRWYGEYPSMWLAPADLLTQIRKRLAA